MASRLALILLAVVVCLALIMLLVAWFDPPAVRSREYSAMLSDQQRAELAPDIVEMKRLWIVGAGRAGLLVLVGVGLGLALTIVREPLLVRPHKGVYPGTLLVRVNQPVGDHQAHVALASVSGNFRPAGRPASPRPVDLPQLAAPAVEVLDPVDALRPDMAHFNNLLFIGMSGSGKTNAGWAVAGRYRQALPDVEFLICSLVASKWPGMCQASTPAAMLDALRAVDGEFRRRDDLLSRAGITDVHGVDTLNALIVVLDEAESAVNALTGAERTEFRTLLDRLVNTGRNVNLGLLALSQTGDRGFFPKSILANSRIFIGRSGPWVPQAYGINDPAQVESIRHAETGRFYSLADQAWVSVPVVKPPTALRLSDIYRAPLQLPADAEADGLGAEDAPSTPAEYSYTVQGTQYTPPPGGGMARYTGIVYRVPVKNVPEGRELADYDEALHRRIWEAAQVVPSNKVVQRLVDMGYEGGSGWYLIREIRRLGQAEQLPWQV